MVSDEYEVYQGDNLVSYIMSKKKKSYIMSNTPKTNIILCVNCI